MERWSMGSARMEHGFREGAMDSPELPKFPELQSPELQWVPRNPSRVPQFRGTRANKSADSTLPLRRSTRKRIHSSLSPDEDTPAISPVQTHVGESPLVAYVDSSALQYSCDHSSFKDPSLLPSCGSISGFRLTGKTMRDTRLTKIYSLDVSYLTESRFLVTAGGHGGFISIFGGDMEEQIDQENQQQHEAGAVMSWRGSKSWISGVRFVNDNPMMLVSSSNDGKLIVWDTSKSAVESKSPLIVAESKGLHSNGIFGMDKCGHTIATASKDSSVGIWKMSSSGEVVAEGAMGSAMGFTLSCIRFKDLKM